MGNTIMRRVPVHRNGLTDKKPALAAAGGLRPKQFASVNEAIAILRPAEPMYCYAPAEIEKNAALFLNHFQGSAHYAVKANSDPYILSLLYAAGIHHFDVASLGEVKLVREMFPEASLAFMHPVKAREAIVAAYRDYGVRSFVLDSKDELTKIRRETKGARDLTLIVRLAMPKGSAATPLDGKFGADPELAVSLLRDIAKEGKSKIGISFHVGSQTTDPSSYADAIRLTGRILMESGVKLDVLDVGGGFPIAGLNMETPPLGVFFDVIRAEIATLGLPSSCQIWSEPGAALVGTSGEIVVRVELRKGDLLYLNDGNFGGLRDLCYEKRRNEVRRVRLHGSRVGEEVPAEKVPLKAFRFYGPTCESMDYMRGPFMLPENIAEGDWIVVRSLGSYGQTFRAHYNGFYSDLKVEITEGFSGKLLQLRPNRRK
jgi:ornithine decarboxylase